MSYRTLKRRLQVYSGEGWREQLAAARAARVALGPATLVLYDVTVRREALVVRLEVGDLHRGSRRSGGRGTGGSPSAGTRARVGAALTKSCRVSTVGWRGRGERTEEVYERNRCHHLS